MNDFVSLAIPAFVKKQLEPLQKEIAALREKVEKLESEKRRRSVVDRVMRRSRR